MTITAKLSAVVRVKGNTTGIAGVDFDINEGGDVSLANGTGAGQASKVYAGTRSLNASASENLDLAGGLTDPFGAALTFTAIKAIWIETAPTNTNDLVVGGAASNGFVGPFGDATDTFKLKPGSQFMFAHPGAGWTVTASTGDLLKMLNSAAGSAVKYNIVIIGV